MLEVITRFLDNIVFIFQRMTWLDVIDLFLVTLVFFLLLQFLRDTQAIVLLRGALFLIVLVSLLASLEVLPAFSWLVRNTLPAMLLAIPVIFAPEIRRTLERLGRAGSVLPGNPPIASTQETISAVIKAVTRLAERKHGALIVLQRMENLEDFVRTGVIMNAQVSSELLLQVFYPNTPLHDGAVIISDSRLVAAACVLPLSASGVLAHAPDRQMGLRHRAALGISEVSDAVAVVVSEETGYVSIVHAGKMIRRLTPERLEGILSAFFRPTEARKRPLDFFLRLFGYSSSKDWEAR